MEFLGVDDDDHLHKPMISLADLASGLARAVTAENHDMRNDVVVITLVSAGEGLFGRQVVRSAWQARGRRITRLTYRLEDIAPLRTASAAARDEGLRAWASAGHVLRARVRQAQLFGNARMKVNKRSD